MGRLQKNNTGPPLFLDELVERDVVEPRKFDKILQRGYGQSALVTLVRLIRNAKLVGNIFHCISVLLAQHLQIFRQPIKFFHIFFSKHLTLYSLCLYNRESTGIACGTRRKTMKKVWKYGISVLFVALFALSSLCGCGIFGSSPSYDGGGSSSGSSGSSPKIEFASGSGTESDPYVIAEPYQWLNIKNHLSSHYVLNNDLNMGDYSGNKYVYCIGSDSTPFTGSIDGRGHSLHSGRFVGEGGLFGVIYGGAVCNLTLRDSKLEVRGYYAGAFASVIKMGASIENCHVRSCNLIFKSDDDNVSYLGGFIGKVSSASSVIYCSSDVSTENDYGYPYASYYAVGGFAGSIDGGKIDACWATGSLHSPASDNGGIVAYVTGGTVTNVYSECTFHGTDRWGATRYGTIAYYSSGGYHVSYGLSFSNFVGETEGMYYVIKTAFEDETCHAFGANDIESSNDILDSDEWKDNKLWKKGKLHPELVSYEEYLALTAEA